MPICRRLLAHLVRIDCSRALLSAGIKIEISTAMIPMTTRSSTRVNAAPLAFRGRCESEFMQPPHVVAEDVTGQILPRCLTSGQCTCRAKPWQFWYRRNFALFGDGYA